MLYQSILNAKLTGRKKLDRKRCTSNRDDRKHLIWAKEKKNWTVAQWSSFQIKVNLAFNLEIKVPETGGRVERHRIQVA